MKWNFTLNKELSKRLKTLTKQLPWNTNSEGKSGLPKVTERFGAVIKAHLDKRAEEDELFITKYEAFNRPIEYIVRYIIGGFSQNGLPQRI